MAQSSADVRGRRGIMIIGVQKPVIIFFACMAAYAARPRITKPVEGTPCPVEGRFFVLPQLTLCRESYGKSIISPASFLVSSAPEEALLVLVLVHDAHVVAYTSNRQPPPHTWSNKSQCHTRTIFTRPTTLMWSRSARRCLRQTATLSTTICHDVSW